MSDINKEKTKPFSTFRKQLNEQTYRPVNEGAVKAAMEDWMESLPDAVVDEINRKYAAKLKAAQLTGLSMGDPVRKALIQLLDKHKVKPALGDLSRKTDISALEMMFNTFFGEGVEVNEENFNYGAYGYRVDEASDTPTQHALNIARKTVKMNDVFANIMGGMSKKQAHEFLLKHGTRAEKRASEKWLFTHMDKKSVKEEIEQVDEASDKQKKNKLAHSNEGVKEDTAVAEGVVSHDRKSLEKMSISQLRELLKKYTDIVLKGQAAPENRKYAFMPAASQKTLADIRGILRARGAGSLLDEGEGVRTEEELEVVEAGQAKLLRLGKAYDKARIGARGVLDPENRKRVGDAYFKLRDKVLDKRKKRMDRGTFDKEAEWRRFGWLPDPHRRFAESECTEGMAKVTLNPKKKIGYEIRDVGPGGKSTVVKRENWPKKKSKGKPRE